MDDSSIQKIYKTVRYIIINDITRTDIQNDWRSKV